MRIILATLLGVLALTATVATAETASTAATAPGMHAADADRWLQQYARALQQQDAAALATLFDDTATVTVEFSEAGEAASVITLTGAEFLQQQRALWRFADQHRYTLRRTALAAAAIPAPAAAGESLSLTLDMQEHHRLFGNAIGQQHRLTVRLENRDGSLRATAVNSITTSLQGQP